MEIRNFELINSLETFKDLFDSAHDLIHIADVSGNLLYVNRAWETALEYSSGDVRNVSIYDLVVPGQREEFRSYRQRVIAGATPEPEMELNIVTRSGRIVHLAGFVSARIKDGVTLYTRGIFRDVTHKVRNEVRLRAMNAELREREQNRRHLLHNAPDAIVVIDAESRITYWNPKAEQVFGWTAQEITGKTLSETIVPPQHRAAHENGMRRYLSTGVARVLNKPIEITAMHRSGKEFFISLTISTTMQHGNVAFIAFLRDIDQEKRNQRELDKKKEELEKANYDLQQFAHVISHDMKEPVRKINMYTDRLMAEDLSGVSAAGRKFLEKIHASGLRLSKMIDDVLNYSFQLHDRPAFEQVDLQAIVNLVLRDLELVIAEKKAVVSVQPLPSVEAVPVMMSQLFYNLIVNSLKFAKTGVAPQITLNCRKINEEMNGNTGKDTMYEFTIIDNGIGFRPEEASKIFERFSRLHSKSEYEGTGLGLALCKRIAEYHGGAIAASSDGTGATFTFVIPEKQNVRAGAEGQRGK